jgi:hypothetical protein
MSRVRKRIVLQDEVQEARLRNPLKNEFVTRHYRTIIFSLVLMNTALIFFLIVFIWSYGPENEPRGRFLGETIRHAAVVADSQTVWSEPGGSAAGAEKRGVLERGLSVEIVDSSEVDGEPWCRLLWEGGGGWVPARAVRFIRTAR